MTNNGMSFDKRAILGQLDHCAQNADFPILDNLHWRVSKVRLTAFTGKISKEWVIAFEIVAFDVRADAFLNILYAYGNKIARPGFVTSEDVFSESAEHPFEDNEGNIIINLRLFAG